MANFSKNGVLRIAILSFLWISFASGIRITLTPSEVSKKTNESFVIKCQLDGDGASGQDVTAPVWFKVYAAGKDQLVPTSGRYYSRVASPTSTLLMFSNAQMEDAGDYKCVGGGAESTITVKLRKAIVFVNTPTTQNPIKGTDAVIKCHAEADPPADISWSARGQDGDIPRTIAENGGRFTTSATGDLNIPNFDPDTDNGVYICEAVQTLTGDMGSVSISVIGHVPPSTPHIELMDKEKWPNGIHENATNVKLSCGSSGGVPSPNYTWTKDNADLTGAENIFYPKNGILEFARVNRNDGGKYRCTAKNVVDEAGAEIEVSVFKLPVIGKIPSQQVMADGDVSFECSYDGSDSMEPSWVFLGSVIPVRNEQNEIPTEAETKHDKYVIKDPSTKKATLYLKSVKLDDAGEYQCRVSNEAGSVFESANLEVRRAPLVVSYTNGGKVRGVLNKEYSLYCEAEAVPEPRWTWLKDSDVLSEEMGRVEIQSKAVGSNHFVSTLKIVPVADYDFTVYQCKASNGLEPEGTKEITILKIDPPKQPEITCNIGEQKPTIITLSIPNFSSTMDEKRLPTEVDIVVTRLDNPSVITSANLKYDQSGFYKIPKLDPSTTYVFNVTGKNEAGFSQFGLAECNTPEPALPGKPIYTNGTFNCDSTQQCIISWTLDDTGGKPITNYNIRYRPLAKDGEPQEEFRTFVVGAQSFTLTDLKPDTIYEFHVSAKNEIGQGEETTVNVNVPASAQSTDIVYAVNEGPSVGAIVGIVILIVLLILILVDVWCYYSNQCGLLMCICTNVCGKTPPEHVKSKEQMMETGTVKEKVETYEQKVVVKEHVLVTTERAEGEMLNESTPMIPSGQNGHHEKSGKVTTDV